jgi:hypothetical protein
VVLQRRRQRIQVELLKQPPPRVRLTALARAYITKVVIMMHLISALAVVALTMAALPAAPAERIELPAEMLGDWCLQQENEVLTFRRDDCLDQADNWLLIDRDGYRGHEFGCKTVKSSISRHDARYVVYVLESLCEGDSQTWDAIISMWLSSNDSLIVQTGDASRSGEKQ